MVFPAVLSRLAEWVIYQLLGNSCYKLAIKMRNYGFHFSESPSLKLPSFASQISSPPSFPNLPKNPDLLPPNLRTFVFDLNGTLLRSSYDFFPYFMLVAFEGGSIIRAFLLLLTCPILWVLDNEAKLKVMIFITFCGLRLKDLACVQRTVLPKFFLEKINFSVYQVVVRVRAKVVFTTVPRIMVEGFLKEYLKVDQVVGSELQTFGSYFTGLLDGPGLLSKHKALKEYFGDESPDVGIGNSTHLDNLFLSSCTEACVVKQQEDAKNDTNGTSFKLPRNKHPKPLIFHDGRLAFLPTPTASLCMFIWLPLGILLAIFRLFVGIVLPYKLAILLGTFSGVMLRTKGITIQNSPNQLYFRAPYSHKGVLYVCTHRTLLDPVILGLCLRKPLTAVTYSLSRMSEIIAPLRTVRLTRDRRKDAETMGRLLSEGDLVVCPEGTTCREPYLLRFSSLFAELANEIVPVAINTKVSIFYGTTASGLKWLDPIFFLMNPKPCYYLHLLGKSPKEETCGGGRSSIEVANLLQRQLADALGFECTNLTRKDKYLMLAGNDGRVSPRSS